jgi:hypothetical protein
MEVNDAFCCLCLKRLGDCKCVTQRWYPATCAGDHPDNPDYGGGILSSPRCVSCDALRAEAERLTLLVHAAYMEGYEDCGSDVESGLGWSGGWEKSKVKELLEFPRRGAGKEG